MQKVKDEKVWKQVEDGVELNLCYRIKKLIVNHLSSLF